MFSFHTLNAIRLLGSGSLGFDWLHQCQLLHSSGELICVLGVHSSYIALDFFCGLDPLVRISFPSEIVDRALQTWFLPFKLSLEPSSTSKRCATVVVWLVVVVEAPILPVVLVVPVIVTTTSSRSCWGGCSPSCTITLCWHLFLIYLERWPNPTRC